MIAQAAAGYAASLLPNGTWADVDYKDKTRGAWKTEVHMKRVEAMAQALPFVAGPWGACTHRPSAGIPATCADICRIYTGIPIPYIQTTHWALSPPDRPRTTQAGAGRTALLHATASALGNWLAFDYRNPNWWCQVIGTPVALITVLLNIDAANATGWESRGSRPLL